MAKIGIAIKGQNILIPEPNDPCNLWVSYFDKLKSIVGKENARVLWLVTWQNNGASSCTTSPEFNGWLRKQNIDVSNAATRAIADASQIGSNFMGLGKNLSKILSIGVPITLAIVLVVILGILWNTSKEVDAKDLVQLTPMGRSIGAGMKFLNK